MAIGQVRFYLLGFHLTLASAQALAQGNIGIWLHYKGLTQNKRKAILRLAGMVYHRFQPETGNDDLALGRDQPHLLVEAKLIVILPDLHELPRLEAVDRDAGEYDLLAVRRHFS